MELKVYSTDKTTKLTTNIDNNTNKTLNSSENFSNIINKVKSQSTNIDNTKIMKSLDHVVEDRKTGNPLIDGLHEENRSEVLGAIGTLDQIFGINMLGSQGDFFNKDGTVNIVKIIDLYGNNVSSNDFKSLSASLETLKDNGLISTEDYIYAIKWIQTKKAALNMKMHFQEIKDSLINELIYKHKNSHIK